jgi:hypothetical protein
VFAYRSLSGALSSGFAGEVFEFSSLPRLKAKNREGAPGAHQLR